MTDLISIIAMPTHDLFSGWLAAVANRAGITGVDLRWRIGVADRAIVADTEAAGVSRRCAEAVAAAAWADIRGIPERPPPEALRAGSGPRHGIHENIRWAASLTHSARAKTAAAGFLVQRSGRGAGLLFGIDLERSDRAVSPNVRRVICPRIDDEAPPVRHGAIPMLAVICIKEAAFKSDAAQLGRTVGDYVITVLDRNGPEGWAGCVRARRKDRAQFHVAVHEIASYWLAMSVAITPEQPLETPA